MLSLYFFICIIYFTSFLFVCSLQYLCCQNRMYIQRCSKHQNNCLQIYTKDRIRTNKETQFTKMFIINVLSVQAEHEIVWGHIFQHIQKTVLSHRTFLHIFDNNKIIGKQMQTNKKKPKEMARVHIKANTLLYTEIVLLYLSGFILFAHKCSCISL